MTSQGLALDSRSVPIASAARGRHFVDPEQLYLAIVKSSDDAIITKTLDGTITSWNAAAEKLFGYTAEEAVGEKIDIIVPPEQRNQVRLILQKIGAGERFEHFETVRVTKDGRKLDISLSVSPVKAPDGTIVGAAKVARDVTLEKQIQRELAARTAELQRSNEDLAQFAYVASHDLQEPLRMVATYTELLSEHHKDAGDEKTEKYIRFASEGAMRMQQLIKDLLAYSRVDTRARPPEPVDSGLALKEALDRLETATDESHAEIDCETLPTVMIDAVQLAQVFQNLVGNALKFRGERPPRIHIGAERAGGVWRFRVEDNGIGIGKQHVDVIFQMFQRLHERGRYEGSGIGLALTKKIIERSGGRIWVESEPNRGSTFFFTVPGINGDAP